MVLEYVLALSVYLFSIGIYELITSRNMVCYEGLCNIQEKNDENSKEQYHCFSICAQLLWKKHQIHKIERKL